MYGIEVQLPKLDLTLRGLSNFEDGVPEVIALHGWLDNANSLIPVVERMDSYKVMILDLPGHGLSDHVHAGQVPQFHDYVYFLAEVYEVLGIDQAIILGHSMGGAAATLFAGSFPDKVSSFIMIESIGPISTAEDQAPQKMAQAVESWLRHSRRTNPIYENLDSAIATRQKAGNLSFEISEALTKRGTRSVDEGIQWTHDPKLKLPSPRLFSEAQVLSYLGAIDCPTLFIRGTGSYLMNSETVDTRMKTIKNLCVKDLEGGHHIHMEKPVEVSEIIKTFILNGHFS